MKLNVVELSKSRFDDIVITDRFAKHPPKVGKVICKMMKFFKTKDLGDLLVDEKMELIDGYCSYLIAKEIGTDFIKIKQVKVKK